MPKDDLAQWATAPEPPWPTFATADKLDKWAASRKGRDFLAKHFVRGAARRWKEAHNPLDALLTYQLARRVQVPIPEWVLRYLDKAAEALLNMAESDVPRPRRPSQVLTALQLRRPGPGRKSDAFDSELATRDWKITHRVFLLRREKQTYQDARGTAADEFGVSESLVDRAWRKHHASVKAEVERAESRKWLLA